jgi:hypothetical protein
MIQQKAKKKRPNICKWIGLTLLAILIILALIFFVLIIWVFLPEDNEGWRPYTFDKEFAALEEKYAIPDSENAATIYNELLESHDANVFEPDFMDDDLDRLTLREPRSGKDHPELAKWLQDQQSTIAKLFEASKVAKCAFPIPKNKFTLPDTIDHLLPIRHWAFLLVRAGNNDLAEGRIEEGLQKYLCVGKMGDHLRQQSTLLEMLVGIAAEALALGRFKAFVVTAEPTEEHLSLVEKAVADMKHDWNSDLPRFLEYEKLMAGNLLSGMLYEVNAKGKTRLSRDHTGLIIDPLFDEIQTPTNGQRKLMKIGAVFGCHFVPATPKQTGEIIDGSYEELYAMVKPDFDWQRKPQALLSLLSPWSVKRIRFNFGFAVKLIVSMSKESIYRFHDLYLRADAEQKGSRIIIALRRYKNKTGHWPQNLDDIKKLVTEEVLIDPRNRGSFVYKLTEENFTLYSKGKNEIDEGGKYLPSAGEEPDDWTIWPKPVYKPSPSPLLPPPPPPPPPPPSPQSRPSQKKENNAYSK